MVKKKTKAKKSRAIKQKKQLNKKILIITSIVGVGILLIVAATIAYLVCNNRSVNNADDIDFNQRVTGLDGRDFKNEFDASVDESFIARFEDLKCNDDCSNISNLKIGTRELKLGEDYEIRRGSVIIVIYKKILQVIKNGQYDVTFDIKDGNKTITVGIRITVSNNVVQGQDAEEQISNSVQAGENVSSEPEIVEINTSGDSQNNSVSDPTATPIPEPTPTPEPTPEPEPVVPTCNENQVLVDNNCVDKEPEDIGLRINLNDPGYSVKYMAVHSYRVDENLDPIMVNNEPVDVLDAVDCVIYKNDVQIYEGFFKFTGSGSLDTRVVLSEQGYMDTVQEINNRGDGYFGMGSGFGPMSLAEHSDLCDPCNVICDRW